MLLNDNDFYGIECMCSKHDRRMTTIIHQKSCARSLPTLTCKTNADVLTTIGKMTTSSNILYYFERVPEVTIDQSQGSTVDWVKDVKKNNYWKSFIWCLLKSTKGPTKHPNLSPKPHPKTKTPSKTAILKENKTKSVVQLKPTANTRITTSMPTATSSPLPPRRDKELSWQRAEHSDRDWIAANVWKIWYDLFLEGRESWCMDRQKDFYYI